MSFHNLTDSEAVKDALQEFDQLGRQPFLSRYGFGPARRYFLLYRGMRYDSKAIVGAAYGVQFPDEGPLGPGDFSGGEDTVAKKLRSLGFEVTTTGYDPRPPRYWVFRARPDRYKIRDAVKHLDRDCWTIERSDVRAGDHAAIWQTQDEQGRRGVVGLGVVLEDPTVCSDEDNPYWIDPRDGVSAQARVPVQYLSTQNLPLWLGEEGEGAILTEWSAAKSHGGTVFQLDRADWMRVIEIADCEEFEHTVIPSSERIEQALVDFEYERDNRKKPDGYRWSRFRGGWQVSLMELYGASKKLSHMPRENSVERRFWYILRR